MRDRALAQLGVSVAGQLRAARGVTMAPGWQHRNGADNVDDDIALVTLDRPVDGVTRVGLGGARASTGTLLGKGLTRAGGVSDLVLRRAELRTMGDGECRRAWGAARGNGGERFRGSTMLCAIDVDGRRPLSSGCNGDSGGPLFAGPVAAPRVVGVLSFGGLQYGADHLPSVFTDVDRYRGFVLQRTPTFAPVATGAARITGAGRVGRLLRCRAPRFRGGARRVTTRWVYHDSRGEPVVLGKRRTYRVGRAARGKRVFCRVEGSNRDGPALAPQDSVTVPR